MSESKSTAQLEREATRRRHFAAKFKERLDRLVRLAEAFSDAEIELSGALMVPFLVALEDVALVLWPREVAEAWVRRRREGILRSGAYCAGTFADCKHTGTLTTEESWVPLCAQCRADANALLDPEAN